MALPGPHGDAKVPNFSPLPDAAVVGADPDEDPLVVGVADDDPPVEDELDDELRLLLHATATSATAHSALDTRNHRRVRPTGSPSYWSCQSPLTMPAAGPSRPPNVT